MKKSKTILSACVDRQIYASVKKLADSMGISLSEYLRRLILDDLDQRTVFTTMLKS